MPLQAVYAASSTAAAPPFARAPAVLPHLHCAQQPPGLGSARVALALCLYRQHCLGQNPPPAPGASQQGAQHVVPAAAQQPWPAWPLHKLLVGGRTRPASTWPCQQAASPQEPGHSPSSLPRTAARARKLCSAHSLEEVPALGKAVSVEEEGIALRHHVLPSSTGACTHHRGAAGGQTGAV